jgi:hypothetical protein
MIEKKISLWFNIISELLIDLSAGWFGAAFIVSTFSEKSLSINFGILILDIGFGILFLLVAFNLRFRSK